MKKSILVFIAFLLISIPSWSFDKNSAYISLFAQRTEILMKEKTPMTKTSYEINFKFNDEKAITLFHSYSIYYSHFDKIENLEVYTKNPTGNGKFKKIDIKEFKKSNAKSSSVFYDDQTEISIDFLGLVVGSEAYVSYTMTTEELHFTDPMTFRYYLPIEKMEYQLTVPTNFNVSFIEKNIPPNFYQYTKEDKKNETIHNWIVQNIEPEKNYDNAPSSLYYTPHILYKINDYTFKGEKKTISNSPKDLYDWYIKNIKEVNSKPSERIKTLTDSVIKGATTELEKVKRIYDWVRTNIRYVAFEAGMEGLIPREAEAICTKRYGDCKDMSSIQFAMLRAANIKGYLVWIGSRRIPYTYSEVPLKNTDNHMIAAYKNGAEWVFLDATDPNGIFGLPADHIQGKQAMIGLTDSTYELAMVPVVSAKVNALSETCIFNLKNNDVEINSVSKYGGLYAGNLANQLHYLTDKEKEDMGQNIVKAVSNNAILKSSKFPQKNEFDNATIELNYSIKDYVKEVGNEKYINLFMDKMYMNSNITEENRTAQYSFTLNNYTDNKYILNIPENYKVSFKPENTSYKNNNFGFDINYKMENNQLICNHIVYADFPTLLMTPNQFNDWNTFVKQINKSYKESIILEKK